jgi:hypothetical protein
MTFAQVGNGQRFRWFGMLCVKRDNHSAYAILCNIHGNAVKRTRIPFDLSETVTLA